MELWIRSQDKRSLTPITSHIIEINNSLYHLGMPLADYKTKERALEVLDEIQEHIRNTGKLVIEENGLKQYDNVYEMPEE